MAVLDGVDNLEEDATDEVVVAQVPLAVRDHPKQVALVAELEHDVGTCLVVDDVIQRRDVGVLRRRVVQVDLALLKAALSHVEADLVQAFDGVERQVAELGVRAARRVQRGPRGNVAREVDDAVGAEPENRHELEVRDASMRARVVDDLPDEVLRMARVLRGHGGLRLGERRLRRDRCRRRCRRRCGCDIDGREGRDCGRWCGVRVEGAGRGRGRRAGREEVQVVVGTRARDDGRVDGGLEVRLCRGVGRLGRGRRGRERRGRAVVVRRGRGKVGLHGEGRDEAKEAHGERCLCAVRAGGQSGRAADQDKGEGGAVAGCNRDGRRISVRR